MTNLTEFYKSAYNIAATEMAELVFSDEAQCCTGTNIQILQNYRSAYTHVGARVNPKPWNCAKKTKMARHVNAFLLEWEEAAQITLPNPLWEKAMKEVKLFLEDVETIYPVRVDEEKAVSVYSAKVMMDALYEMPVSKTFEHFLTMNRQSENTDVKACMRMIKRRFASAYDFMGVGGTKYYRYIHNYLYDRRITLDSWLCEALTGPTQSQLEQIPNFMFKYLTSVYYKQNA